MVGIGGKLQETKMLQFFSQETSLKQYIYVQNLEKQNKHWLKASKKKMIP